MTVRSRATRRLWTRRAIRAGWLLGPILEIPGKFFRLLGKVFSHFFGNPADALISIVILSLVAGVGSCSYNAWRYSDTATSAQLKQYATGNADPRLNWCITNDIPKQIQRRNRALQWGELETIKSDCIRVNQEALEKDEQLRIANELAKQPLQPAKPVTPPMPAGVTKQPDGTIVINTGELVKALTK